jgi:hypothetical protein
MRLLDKADKQVNQAVRVALYNEMVAIMRVSIRQTPEDTGYLRATAYVTLPTTTGQIRIQAGYATYYAIYVHERTDVSHAPPTKDHYLSDPMTDRSKGFADRVAKAAKKMIASGSIAPLSPVMRTNENASTGRRMHSFAQPGKAVFVGAGFKKTKGAT